MTFRTLLIICLVLSTVSCSKHQRASIAYDWGDYHTFCKLSGQDSTPEAMHNFAFCYEKGLGHLNVNREMAVYWYDRAASDGFQPSIDALTRLGEPIPQSAAVSAKSTSSLTNEKIADAIVQTLLAALSVYTRTSDRPTYSGSKIAYEIEAAANDEVFLINGEVFKAKTYCFNWDKGDKVIFLDGSAYGTCISAKLLNKDRDEVCEVWCE